MRGLCKRNAMFLLVFILRTLGSSTRLSHHPAVAFRRTVLKKGPSAAEAFSVCTASLLGREPQPPAQRSTSERRAKDKPLLKSIPLPHEPL